MRQNLITQSANRIVIEFDSQQIGLLQSVSGDENYGLEPVMEIGNISVAEHVPTAARYSINYSKMALIKEKMRSAGIEPENAQSVLQGNVLNVVIYSKDTGAALRTFSGCSFESGRIDVSANRVVSKSGVMRAISVSGTGL